MSDTYRVRWLSDYPDWSFDPDTKLGQGLCSATACDAQAVLVTERRTRRHSSWGDIVQRRGHCFGHAQVLTRGYWTPGMAPPEADE